MVRLVSVHCPKIYSDQVLGVVRDLSDTYLFQVTVDKSEENIQICFKLKDKHLQYVLERINDVGCGRIYGHIDVMPVLLSRPPISTLGIQPREGEKKKRKYQINERMTVDEINSLVDDRNHLTFNYMMLMLIASTMAGTGILTSSTVYIIASVLISPLMGPILSITFGLAVNDLATIKKGMRNELIGIGISLAVGLLIGVVGAFIYPPSYRSSEITSRGQAMNLLAGFVVALCSGVAVVLGVTTGGASALIGTSISASLLAPLVNGAICLAMAFIYHVVHDANHDSREYSIWAYTSFSLFCINLSTIVSVGFLTFRYIKDVKPEHQKPFNPSFDAGPTVPNNSLAYDSSMRLSAIQLNALHEGQGSSLRHTEIRTVADMV